MGVRGGFDARKGGRNMNWTYKPGEAFPLLVLNQHEAKVMREIVVRYARGPVLRKFEKYKDVHDGGEATVRQDNLMVKYEELLGMIDKFLSYTESRED